MQTSHYPQHSFERRKEVSQKLRTQHPDRVPVIINVDPKCKTLKLDTNKYITPGDITLSKFLLELRRHIKTISPYTAIYLILENGTLPSLSTMMSTLDTKHRNSDGFLYFSCCEENTFG